MTTIGDIILDGNLTDWNIEDRLDYLPGTGVEAYQLYGKYTGDNYVFALKLDPTATSISQIGTFTTFWFNTDQNTSTGYPIFGYAGGAEYNVNFFTDNQPYLYTGAAGEIFQMGPLAHAYNSDRTIIEFAVPISSLNLTKPRDIDVLVDINNNDFLPDNYGYRYTVDFEETSLPERTDFSKKVGIVFSETTADKFFKRPGETESIAYSQLFMSMQYQAMQAGIPFDLLTEDDLTDINNIVNYDALIFPSFSHVSSAKLDAIEETLLDAVYKYNIGIITAGDFLTNDENGAPLPDTYQRMREILNLTIAGGSEGNPTDITLRVTDGENSVLQGYATDEVIRQYIGASYNNYNPVDDRYAGEVLVDFLANGQSQNAVQTTQTGGRNVHFGTSSFLADDNLAWQALQWAVYGEEPSARLNMSRDASIFISRTDMDQSQEAGDINPPGNTPGIYDKLLPILNQWKQDYNFVGSYYLNIGNNPNNSQYTDWTVSKPYYQQILAAGNEIGTHSYTHLYDYVPPNDTASLTTQQLQLEFLASKALIEKQLGITNIGTAIPGQPEPLSVSQVIKDGTTFTKSQLDQFDPADQFNSSLGNQLGLVNPNDTISVNGTPYVTGGYASVGAGYPGAFGLPFPGQDFVYFAPNMSFDFSLVEFLGLTAAEAEAEWLKEYEGITNHAAQGIIHFPWHDYGPTNWDADPTDNLPAPGYTEAMFSNFLARAYNDNTEFVTAAEVANRIKTFEKTQVFSETIGKTINTTINGSNLGAFSLNVEGTIQNVTNWYAYDNNTVFLDQDGGTFNINLGATQDDVTHIIDLPMRSDLISVTGNGTNLEFSFSGQGTVTIDLKALNPAKYTFQGADSTVLNGEILQMNFNTLGQHTGQINFVNNAPVAVNDSYSVNEDTTLTIAASGVIGNDTDVDNDPLSATLVSGVSHGTISFNSNGSFSYTPNANYNGPDSFTYKVNDGQADSNTATVTLNVLVNSAPVAFNDSYSINEDTTLNITAPGVIGNDTDVENNTLTASVVTNPSHGSLNFNANGSFSYTPNANYNGPDSFTYKVNDGQANSNTATVNFTVNPVGNVINGTNANNNIDGTDRRDIIYGFAGNDKIDSKKGDDVVYGGEGNDTIKGGDDNDYLVGGKGNDYLDGGKGNDILIGVDPNDNLPGVGEIDSLKGGGGEDLFILGDANRSYYNDGNNSNKGFKDYALITDFKLGQDVIQLYGSTANYGLTEAPEINGIDDDATAIYLKTSGLDELIGIIADIEDDEISLDSSSFSYTPYDGQALTNQFEGTSSNNDISGTDSNDLIQGFAGDDKLDGKEGDDTIYGGDGDDNLKGDKGDDVVFGDAGNDYIFGGDGDDTIYGGIGNDIVEGDKGSDILYGGDGNDFLDGKEDGDTLYGGAGDDIVEGGGGSGADLLYGEDGNDSLYGGDGIDTLYGGKGNDFLYGDKKNDILIGVDPNDIPAGDGERDTLSGGGESDRFVLGDANQVYYRSQGTIDFALINDFETSKDVIQLKGDEYQYRLGATSGILPTGTGIWLKGSTQAQDELIAIAQFIDPTSLNLDSTAFSFV